MYTYTHMHFMLTMHNIPGILKLMRNAGLCPGCAPEATNSKCCTAIHVIGFYRYLNILLFKTHYYVF